jgi:hypothetical protein
LEDDDLGEMDAPRIGNEAQLIDLVFFRLKNACRPRFIDTRRRPAKPFRQDLIRVLP